MLSKEITTDLVNGLCEIFKDELVSIILYGSVARGDDNIDSDVDVAIILQNGLADVKKEDFFELSSRMDIKYDKVFSIIDIEVEKLEQWGKVLPFYKNIKNEGVVLWKAA